MIVKARHVTVFLATLETAKVSRKIPFHLEVLLLGNVSLPLLLLLRFFYITDHFIIGWLHSTYGR
jgi:hypothetical protein